MLEHLGSFYLVGRDSLRARELSFRIDRIREVRRTDATFEKPKNFNAQRYRRAEFYRPSPKDMTVKVKFAGSGARRN